MFSIKEKEQLVWFRTRIERSLPLWDRWWRIKDSVTYYLTVFLMDEDQAVTQKKLVTIYAWDSYRAHTRYFLASRRISIIKRPLECSGINIVENLANFPDGTVCLPQERKLKCLLDFVSCKKRREWLSSFQISHWSSIIRSANELRSFETESPNWGPIWALCSTPSLL